MIAEARSISASAVLKVRFVATSIAVGAAEILACDSAVRLGQARRNWRPAIGALFESGGLLGLLATGLFAGRRSERRHYASIRAREQQHRDVLALTLRVLPDRTTPQEVCLVSGSVVVRADCVKTCVAGLRKLFGGRLRAYESLMERARRATARFLGTGRSRLLWQGSIRTRAVGGRPR